MVWIEELIDDATFQFSVFHFLPNNIFVMLTYVCVLLRYMYIHDLIFLLISKLHLLETTRNFFESDSATVLQLN